LVRAYRNEHAGTVERRVSRTGEEDVLEDEECLAADLSAETQQCGLSHSFGWRKLVSMNNWIVADPEHLGGSPRVRGTRISVALILESFAAGMTIAQIVDAYPSLTEESVRGVLGELAQRKDRQPA
jgi:uncharacterized protein (DUF433 family)